MALSSADQLRAVTEHVLSFAVRELTKIVEASFDDLLLEITKMEAEQQVLEERLGTPPSRGGGGGGLRKGSENDSASPSGSEDARAELPEVTCPKQEVGSEGELSARLLLSNLSLVDLRPPCPPVRPGAPPRPLHVPGLEAGSGQSLWSEVER